MLTYLYIFKCTYVYSVSTLIPIDIAHLTEIVCYFLEAIPISVTTESSVSLDLGGVKLRRPANANCKR